MSLVKIITMPNKVVKHKNLYKWCCLVQEQWQIMLLSTWTNANDVDNDKNNDKWGF